MLETNEERLAYVLKNKKKYFQNGTSNKKRKKRTTYKVVGELLKIHELIKQRIFRRYHSRSILLEVGKESAI
jgi:hypothetical protein